MNEQDDVVNTLTREERNVDKKFHYITRDCFSRFFEMFSRMGERGKLLVTERVSNLLGHGLLHKFSTDYN